MDVEKVLAFYLKHMPNHQKNKEELRIAIKEHINFNTIDSLERLGKLTAVVRYNISQDGRTAHVLDMAIARGEDGQKVIRYFVARGWSRFPSLKFVRFERELKYDRPQREYPISQFFKKR